MTELMLLVVSVFTGGRDCGANARVVDVTLGEDGSIVCWEVRKWFLDGLSIKEDVVVKATSRRQHDRQRKFGLEVMIITDSKLNR